MKYRAGWDKSIKSAAIKHVRPPMPPLSVRVQVAERQLPQDAYQAYVTYCILTRAKLGKRLFWLLQYLFEKPELHHSPALILRPYHPRRKDIAARYEPNANDPDSLVYLEAPDHQERTTGRKPGATHTATTLGSDIHLKTKFARLERKAKKCSQWPKCRCVVQGYSNTKEKTGCGRKRRAPIKSRGFAKGPKQKIKSRGFGK